MGNQAAADEAGGDDQRASLVVQAGGPIQLDLVPFVKMLAWPDIPQPLRFLAQAVEGAGQPLGSTGQGTVRRAN